VVYNLGGMYELAIVSGRAQHHTKYIHGIQNDLVAQVTRTDSTLVAYLGPNQLRDGIGSSNKIVQTASVVYLAMTESNRGLGRAVKYVPHGLIYLGMGLFIICVYYRVRNRRTGRKYKWAADFAPVVVCAFVSFTGMISCGDMMGDYANVDDGPTATADKEGFPPAGTCCYHPDQVGNVRYITNSEGIKVYESAYTPYGEKVASKTTATVNPAHYMYTGQEDDGTGLYYCRANE
jgi:hypothetical protein